MGLVGWPLQVAGALLDGVFGGASANYENWLVH